ncbi:Na+/H+-exchanging protein [Gemmatimonadetes bacterium T265]|nr:Na+/H+-exchanging protein [Gemmatimonadetes bacterium T265]
MAALAALAFPLMHHLLGTLVALLVATKLLGALAQRFGQPAVLGELLAGVLLGGSLLGVLDPADPVLHAFSELGVLVLLFEIGLETDLRALVRVGGAATTVALVGVALPCALGYAAAVALGLSPIAATVAAASLSATSIGISARVLSDLGQLETPEGQVVLGAAVLDDVVGLVILAVVGAAVAGAGVSAGLVARTTAVAAGFIAGALVLGRLLVPPLFRLIARVETPGTLVVLGLALAYAAAWLAEGAGSATIIGAFAAGLVLHDTPQREELEHAVTTVGHVIVPVFFAVVGASVDVRTLADPRTLAVGGALVAAGVVGKFAAGYAPVWFRGRKALIGAAMIPRGEVGLIFAQAGLASRALSPALFSAVAMMVLATTFLAPPLLARIAGRGGVPDEEARPGDGGVDDLVFGEEGAVGD